MLAYVHIWKAGLISWRCAVKGDVKASGIWEMPAVLLRCLQYPPRQPVNFSWARHGRVVCTLSPSVLAFNQ